VEEESALIFKDFKKLLEKAYLNLEVTSFDGVVDLLRFLKDKNVQIALNTGYDRNTAQLLLNKMNWKLGKEFDVLVTADDVMRGRPYPDMIYEAMNSLGISDPQEVVKAGDSIIDIEEGRNANCGITVGVITGAHTKNQLESARPTFVVEHLIQLQDLLFK
jgi:phosphonatase-like hydrolase